MEKVSDRLISSPLPLSLHLPPSREFSLYPLHASGELVDGRNAVLAVIMAHMVVQISYQYKRRGQVDSMWQIMRKDEDASLVDA